MFHQPVSPVQRLIGHLSGSHDRHSVNGNIFAIELPRGFPVPFTNNLKKAFRWNCYADGLQRLLALPGLAAITLATKDQTKYHQPGQSRSAPWQLRLGSP